MTRRIYISLLMALEIMTSAAADFEAFYNKVENGYNFWLTPPTPGEDAVDFKPLVVYLHGASLRGNNLNTILHSGTLDAVGIGLDMDAYVIGPQTPDYWNPQKVMNTIDYVIGMLPDIDTSRIYVIGMSMGGYGTIDVAASYPDRIAAAVGMCGGGTVKTLEDLVNVPLWIVHGTADSAVSVTESDKVVARIRSVDPNSPRLIYDRVPGMIHSDPARLLYLPQMYKWLFQHSLNDYGRPAAPTFPMSRQVSDTAYRNVRSERVVVPSGNAIFIPAGFE